MGALIAKILKLLGHYGVWYTGQWLKSLKSSSHRELGPLAKYFRFCERSSHKLARSIFFYMARYQKKLERKQMILGRLMEIGTELLAIAATCSYAISLKKENPNDRTPIQLAEYFCNISKRRIRQHFRALSDNDDTQANKLAKSVIDKELKWLEEGIIWSETYQPRQ